jgi:DNA-binding transcriptional LysR family regulator
MDLRLLEYFVAVAELEHVGRAAERLHISQSPLSRQIRRLEEELNLELFVRERQRIRLTESGCWLLDHARKLLGQFDKLRRDAKQRSQGQTGTLSIAFTSAAAWNGILPQALRRFQAKFPGAILELQNLRSAQQVEAVRFGRADIGFISKVPVMTGDLDICCVSEEPFLLAIPESHPLFRKRRLTPQDLDGIPWILLLELHAVQSLERFLAVCAQAGFSPQVVQKVTEPLTLLTLVESGLGVGLIRASARNYAPRSIAFKPLPWFSFKFRTYMIRSKDGRQLLADAFAALIPRVDALVHQLP